MVNDLVRQRVDERLERPPEDGIDVVQREPEGKQYGRQDGDGGGEVAPHLRGEQAGQDQRERGGDLAEGDEREEHDRRCREGEREVEGGVRVHVASRSS